MRDAELAACRRVEPARPRGSLPNLCGEAGTRRNAVRRRAVAAASLVAAAVVAMLAYPIVRDRLEADAIGDGPVTLAVLPLENRTGDPNQEHFSDGLTDRLTTVFGRLRSLRLSVIGRGSSMPYKHSTKPLSQIGRELNANAAVKGFVRRSADRVQILAELVETSTERTLWSATYDFRAGCAPGAAATHTALSGVLSKLRQEWEHIPGEPD